MRLGYRACRKLVQAVRAVQAVGHPEGREAPALWVRWGSEFSFIGSPYFAVRLREPHPNLCTDGWVVDGRDVAKGGKVDALTADYLIGDPANWTGKGVAADHLDPKVITFLSRDLTAAEVHGVLLDWNLWQTVVEVFGLSTVYPGVTGAYVRFTCLFGEGVVAGRVK